LEAPITRPEASRTGETVTETGIERPLLCRRIVSKCSVRSPRLSRERISCSSCRRSGGMIIVIGRPMASSSV
jgi:hypothetical protein